MSETINSLYRAVLGRDADPAGASHFLDELNAGESFADIRHELAYSPEAAIDIDCIYRDVSGQGASASNLSLFQYALSLGGDWTLGRGALERGPFCGGGGGGQQRLPADAGSWRRRPWPAGGLREQHGEWVTLEEEMGNPISKSIIR